MAALVVALDGIGAAASIGEIYFHCVSIAQRLGTRTLSKIRTLIVTHIIIFSVMHVGEATTWIARCLFLVTRACASRATARWSKTSGVRQCSFTKLV